MNTTGIPLKDPAVSAAAGDTEQLERAYIDASTRVGVLIGVGAILLGDSTGFQWLEFPRYVAVILFAAYTLMASWAVLMFRHRRGDQIYITQWYLLGAFLWFPWLYAAGQLMLFVVPVEGVLQSAVPWWYANAQLFHWFGALAHATACYLVPKVMGPPV